MTFAFFTTSSLTSSTVSIAALRRIIEIAHIAIFLSKLGGLFFRLTRRLHPARTKSPQKTSLLFPKVVNFTLIN